MEKGRQTNFSFVVKTRSVWVFISKTSLEKAGPTYLSPGTSAYQSTASRPKTLVHIPICWYHAPNRLCSKFSVESFSLYTSSKSALLGHLNLFFYCMRDFKFIIESCALKITKWKHRFDFLVANSSFAQFSKIQTKLRPSRYVHVRCILAQKSSN